MCSGKGFALADIGLRRWRPRCAPRRVVCRRARAAAGSCRLARAIRTRRRIRARGCENTRLSRRDARSLPVRRISVHRQIRATVGDVRAGRHRCLHGCGTQGGRGDGIFDRLALYGQRWRRAGRSGGSAGGNRYRAACRWWCHGVPAGVAIGRHVTSCRAALRLSRRGHPEPDALRLSHSQHESAEPGEDGAYGPAGGAAERSAVHGGHPRRLCLGGRRSGGVERGRSSRWLGHPDAVPVREPGPRVADAGHCPEPPWRL